VEVSQVERVLLCLTPILRKELGRADFALDYDHNSPGEYHQVYATSKAIQRIFEENGPIASL
jgi:hypothetical protein